MLGMGLKGRYFPYGIAIGPVILVRTKKERGKGRNGTQILGLNSRFKLESGVPTYSGLYIIPHESNHVVCRQARNSKSESWD